MFFKTFKKNYIYMLNLSIYLFGATYIVRANLPRWLTHCKPSGSSSSPSVMKKTKNKRDSPKYAIFYMSLVQDSWEAAQIVWYYIEANRTPCIWVETRKQWLPVGPDKSDMVPRWFIRHLWFSRPYDPYLWYKV